MTNTNLQAKEKGISASIIQHPCSNFLESTVLFSQPQTYLISTLSLPYHKPKPTVQPKPACPIVPLKDHGAQYHPQPNSPHPQNKDQIRLSQGSAGAHLEDGEGIGRSNQHKGILDSGCNAQEEGDSRNHDACRILMFVPINRSIWAYIIPPTAEALALPESSRALRQAQDLGDALFDSVPWGAAALQIHQVPGAARELGSCHQVYRHIYTCIYTYIRVSLYISIYMYTYIYLYIHMYVHFYVYLYVYIYIFTYIYIHIHVCIYIYTHIYIYIYINMYVYIYTHTNIHT